MQPKAKFGRRCGVDKPSGLPNGNPSDVPSGKSMLTDEQRDVIRKLLLATPLIAGLIIVPIVLAKLSQRDGGAVCNPKPAAQRALFEIDWCQAGRAALEGAARGVAGGAGARTVATGTR